MIDRYQRQGFTTVHTNDLYEVERQLQEYDEHLFVMWNPHTGEHLIVDGLIGLSVMKIPQIGFPALTRDVVEHMKKIHTKNGFSATAQVEASDARREADSKKSIEELSEGFARDTLKSARKIAYYQ